MEPKDYPDQCSTAHNQKLSSTQEWLLLISKAQTVISILPYVKCCQRYCTKGISFHNDELKDESRNKIRPDSWNKTNFKIIYLSTIATSHSCITQVHCSRSAVNVPRFLSGLHQLWQWCPWTMRLNTATDRMYYLRCGITAILYVGSELEHQRRPHRWSPFSGKFYCNID